MILPRRRLVQLAAPAIILPHRRSKAMMAIVNGVTQPPAPAWTLVSSAAAQTTSGGNSPNPVVTTGINTGSGGSGPANMLIVAAFAYAPSISGTLTITDSKSNTWTTPGHSTGTTGFFQFTSTDIQTYACYALSPTVGSGHTFTASWTASIAYTAIIALAFKSATGTPFYDANGGAGLVQNGEVSGTTLNVSSITPASNNDLILSCLGDLENTTPYTMNDGFTVVPGQLAPQGIPCAIAYLIRGISAVAPTWTFPVDVSPGGTSCVTWVMGSV